ncbi:hypothetical protein AWB74_06236 [Caballeronia arvi]|uniref:Uncharacterized protein n=1 Tax=Caballeronia arvi TaxID=1777135 RepID=A0A158KPI8_9BURK|nr:hypothetical protein AWB74_06236 [Caballeronia arvi]
MIRRIGVASLWANALCGRCAPVCVPAAPSHAATLQFDFWSQGTAR